MLLLFTLTPSGWGDVRGCPSEFPYWFPYFSAHDGLIFSVIHHVANWWPSIRETSRPPQTIHICLCTLTFPQRFVLMPETVNYSAALPQTRVSLAPLKVSHSNFWSISSMGKRHKWVLCDITKGIHYPCVEFFGEIYTCEAAPLEARMKMKWGPKKPSETPDL